MSSTDWINSLFLLVFAQLSLFRVVVVIIVYIKIAKRLSKIKKLSEERYERAICIKNELKKVVASKVFIDEDSRNIFIEEQCNTIVELISGKKNGRNDYRRTLLGRKGIGKTALLESLRDACNEIQLQQYGLFVVSLDGMHCLPPSIAILLQLPSYYSIPLFINICWNFLSTSPIRTIKQFLINNELFIFGFIDEFQIVYKAKTFVSSILSSQTVSDLFMIGDSSKGRIHWILSGSSTDLRKLISAKLPENEKHSYPAYNSIDSNDTKFTFYTIYPFLTADSKVSLGF